MAMCVVGGQGGEVLVGKQEYLDEPNFTLAMDDETCHPAFATCGGHVASGKPWQNHWRVGSHTQTPCVPLGGWE